jgi:hypothetical protein
MSNKKEMCPCGCGKTIEDCECVEDCECRVSGPCKKK